MELWTLNFLKFIMNININMNMNINININIHIITSRDSENWYWFQPVCLCWCQQTKKCLQRRLMQCGPRHGSDFFHRVFFC